MPAAACGRRSSLMLLGALAEGFGILMIVPLVSVALGQGSGVLAQFGWLVDDIAPDQRFVRRAGSVRRRDGRALGIAVRARHRAGAAAGGI